MKKSHILFRPAPIACVTKTGDTRVICRTDGSIETYNCACTFLQKFPFTLVAVTCLSETRFAGLDMDSNVRAFSNSGTNDLSVLDTIRPDPSVRPILNRNNPGTGISNIEFRGDICMVGSRIFFRFDKFIVKMAIDAPNNLRNRWYSPLMSIEQDQQFSSPMSVVPDDQVLGGLACTSELVFLALFPLTPPQTLHEMSMYLTSMTPSTGTFLETFEVPNIVLENFSRIVVSGNFLFLQTIDCSVRVIEISPAGLRLHSMVSVPIGTGMTTSVPPPSVKRINSLPPLPVSDPVISFFPRYNPQLNVLRKHSQPVAYSSISDTLLNLSLSSRPDNQNNVSGALCTLRDSVVHSRSSLTLPGELVVSDNCGKIFVLTLDRPPFSFVMHASPEKWLLDWANQEQIQGIFFGPNKDDSVVMTDDKLRFIFPNSVQAKVDLVIQLVGATSPYSRLLVDQKNEEDLRLESVWEQRSLAIVPGSHSVVSFDGIDEDTSPRAKQRTSGFSVVDAGVVHCPPSPTMLDDITCEYRFKNGLKLVGNFDGELIMISNDRICSQIPVSYKFSIHSIVGDLVGDRILVGDRGGALYELLVDETREEPLWLLHRHEMGVFAVCVSKIQPDIVLVHCGDKLWTVQLGLGKNLDVREIHLGYPRPIRSVVTNCENKIFALTNDGMHVLRITIDLTSNTSAEYSVNLPFESASTVATSKDKLFILGTIPRLNQRALLEVELNHNLVGAIESSETIALSTVLPFDGLKEEPICVSIWNHELFPQGLVVVGTHGKSRGRVIVFDRINMTPVCKTSIPSRQVSVIQAISPSTIAIGCTECVVLIGLTNAEDDVTLVTLGVYQTYTFVRHINRVNDTRFLIVQSNGFVALLEHKGDSVIQIGTLESQRNIVSSCVLLCDGRFICSSIEGDLLEYSIANVDTCGVMTLTSTFQLGEAVVLCESDMDKVIVCTASGSIFQIIT